jgi:hypothetical protein
LNNENDVFYELDDHNDNSDFDHLVIRMYWLVITLNHWQLLTKNQHTKKLCVLKKVKVYSSSYVKVSKKSIYNVV